MPENLTSPETLAERLKGLVETIEFSVSPDAEIAARFAREALAWFEERSPSGEKIAQRHDHYPKCWGCAEVRALLRERVTGKAATYEPTG